MSDKQEVISAAAPAPAHTFSQGVRIGALIHVSGQGPVDAATGDYLFPGDVAAQTAQTLANVEAVLLAGGACFDDVLSLRVYLTTRSHFAAMNEAYGAFVTSRCPSGVLPARTTVMVELPREEMLVEIDAVAVLAP